MRNYRLHWDALNGWVVDVDVLLSGIQIDRLCEWAIPRQVIRYRSLPQGDKKEELGRAIELLKKRQVRQRLIEKQGVLNVL